MLCLRECDGLPRAFVLCLFYAASSVRAASCPALWPHCCFPTTCAVRILCPAVQGRPRFRQAQVQGWQVREGWLRIAGRCELGWRQAACMATQGASGRGRTPHGARSPPCATARCRFKKGKRFGRHKGKWK